MSEIFSLPTALSDQHIDDDIFGLEELPDAPGVFAVFIEHSEAVLGCECVPSIIDRIKNHPQLDTWKAIAGNERLMVAVKYFSGDKLRNGDSIVVTVRVVCGLQPV